MRTTPQNVPMRFSRKKRVAIATSRPILGKAFAANRLMKSARRPGKRNREKLYAAGRQITAAISVTTGAVIKLYRTAEPTSPLVKTHSHHLNEADWGITFGYRHSSAKAHSSKV